MIEKESIARDAPWVALLNLEKGYGDGFVNLKSGATKVTNAGIGISDGADSGKNWSRTYIRQTPAQLVPGDRFEERTVFLLFRCSREGPLDSFLQLGEEIRTKFAGVP